MSSFKIRIDRKVLQGNGVEVDLDDWRSWFKQADDLLPAPVLYLLLNYMGEQLGWHFALRSSVADKSFLIKVKRHGIRPFGLTWPMLVPFASIWPITLETFSFHVPVQMSSAFVITEFVNSIDLPAFHLEVFST